MIPHPLSALPPAPSARRIDALLRDLAPDRRGPGTPLAIELANPTPSARLGRRRARRLNRERWRLPPTGGSDAHFAPMVASAVTRYPGSSGGDLRRAIEAGLTVAELRRTPSLRELGARRLLRQQLRAAGTTPRVLGRRLAGWGRSKSRGGNGP